MPRNETTDDRTSSATSDDQSRKPADEPQRASTDSTGTETGGGAGDWLASTAVRPGVGLTGVVLLLFALGQAFGVPLLEMTAEAVTSQTGRWLVVAAFALALVGLAERGLSYA